MKNIRSKIADEVLKKIYNPMYETTLQISNHMMRHKEGLYGKLKAELINNIAHSAVPFGLLRKSRNDA